MNGMYRKFVVAIVAACVSAYRPADAASGVGTYVRWDQDITVAQGEVQRYTNIDITKSITIDNAGEITGSIYVGGAFDVFIRNHGGGQINLGNIELSDGAKLIQLINTADDITKLNFGGTPYDVMVSGKTALSFSSILSAASAANRIVLQDAALRLGPGVATGNVNIVVVGTLDVYVDNVGIFDRSPLLAGLTGDGVINVHAGNLDPMYVLQAYVADGALYTRLVRFTNYGFIFNDARGGFLDALRKISPGDKLLLALDSAWTRAELESIMARSVRMNPINMMRPVTVLDNFMVLDSDLNHGPSHMIAEPLFIVSDGFDLYGFRAGVHGRINNRLTLDLTGYAAVAKYSDDINEYSAEMYGGNVAARYDLDILFLRGVAGVTYAMFDVGPVFDGIGMTFDPNGKSMYGALDVGHAFSMLSNAVHVSPFVGVRAVRDRMMDVAHNDTAMRMGMDAGYKIDADGIEYDYGIRATYDDSSRIDAMVRLGIWSRMDDAGADVMFGISDDDIGRSYQFSFGARFRF